MKQRINQMLDNSEQLNKPPFIPIKWQEDFDKKCETSIFGYEVDCVKLKEYIEGIIKQETQSKNPKLSLCSDEPKVGCKWCLCVKNNGRCKCSCHKCKQCKKYNGRLKEGRCFICRNPILTSTPSPLVVDLGKLLIKKKEYGKKIRKTIS